jgi:hypothetical protein
MFDLKGDKQGPEDRFDTIDSMLRANTEEIADADSTQSIHVEGSPELQASIRNLLLEYDLQ